PSEPSRFGFSVAVDGQWAVVGAPEAGIKGIRGAAYLFHRDRDSDPFSLVQTLDTGDIQNAVAFGTAVAIQGDYMLVSAPQGNEGKNSYVFAYQRIDGAWELVQCLVHVEEVTNFPGSGYGVTLSLSMWTDDATGNEYGWLAVGSPNDGDFSGAVYVYGRGHAFGETSDDDKWILETTLTPDESKVWDCSYGDSVLVTQTSLVVGTQTTGNVDVYLNDETVTEGWQIVDYLEVDCLFPLSLSLYMAPRTGDPDDHLDTLVIGCGWWGPNIPDPFSPGDNGAFWVYEREEFSGFSNRPAPFELTQSVYSDPDHGEHYLATSLYVDRDYMLVGAPGGTDAGLAVMDSALVVYKPTGSTPSDKWQQAQVISDYDWDAQLGDVLAVDSDTNTVLAGMSFYDGWTGLVGVLQFDV
ncbi:hypothetical protein KIPB_005160, partial [Kipferlia bialata]